MGKSERSGSHGRNGLPVRIGGAIGGAAGAAGALLWRPDLGGFWQGLAAFVIMSGVGIVLGQLVGRLFFRPSSSDPPKNK